MRVKQQMAGYMWSDDYAFLRGINALDVSARTKLLVHEARKRLIWFYQGLSLSEGGLQKATEEILEVFPDRLSHWHGDPFSKLSKTELVSEAKALARSGRPSPHYGRSIESLTEFIQRLCTCPKLMFPDDKTGSVEFEAERVRQAFPEVRDTPLEVAALPYFKDIIGALEQYKRHYEELTLSAFYKTAIARKTWEAIDRAKEVGKIVVINGQPGRGKTFAARAYCNAHMDTTRFTSLDRGARSPTTAFRCLSDGIGVKCGYKRTIPEIQARTKDVLKRSHIMPVIDEAHYAFTQAAMMTQPPEFIDWLCTALFNEGVPVVLITTPQFIDKVAQAAQQAGWNYKQFERRMEWVELPESNTLDDIRGVAQNVFQNVRGSIIDEVVTFVKKSRRDLSAIRDLCDHLKAAGIVPAVATRLQISEAIESVAPGIVSFRNALEQAMLKVAPRRKAALPIKEAPKPEQKKTLSGAINAPLRQGFEAPSTSREIAPAIVDG